MLAQHLNNHFEEEVIMMHDIVLHTDHTYGYMIESADYDLESIIDQIRETTHLKNNNSKETFIWGINKKQLEKATAHTDNYISLMQDKSTGEYFLIVEDNIIEDGRVDELGILYDMMKRWYVNSDYSAQEEDFSVQLSDIYSDISVTSGDTIKEILVKLDAFLYAVNDN
jgi:hypothetical protein